MNRIIVYKSTGNEKEKWGIVKKYGDTYVMPVLKKQFIETSVDFIRLDGEIIYKSEECTKFDMPDTDYEGD